MLGVPATTDFDLNFRLLRIPVRVNPFFWVAAALLGWTGRSGGEVLVWVACVFASILVHEFGHGLTARQLDRQRPSVVLYWLGGLCSYDREHGSGWRRLAIILMGPGAGFLLYALIGGVGTLATGMTPFQTIVRQPPRWATNPYFLAAYYDLLHVNLWWGLFNLLPIFPLDGGQAVQTLLTLGRRPDGAKWGYVVSIGVAAVLAVYSFQREEQYQAFFMAYLGLINFQLFQAAQLRGRYGTFEDDDNWWRK